MAGDVYLVIPESSNQFPISIFILPNGFFKQLMFQPVVSKFDDPL
jgi:hypothetical protein